MSYVPQATMGGFPGYGAATHSPYLDAATNMQQKMLEHQYTTQVDMIKAECTRNITMTTNQFQQQRDQSILALDQQQKQQEMQLNMAKQQRLMAIQQQAASMQAQAQQYKLQIEMQQKMATLYSGAGAGKTTGTGAAKTTGTGATKTK